MKILFFCSLLFLASCGSHVRGIYDLEEGALLIGATSDALVISKGIPDRKYNTVKYEVWEYYEGSSTYGGFVHGDMYSIGRGFSKPKIMTFYIEDGIVKDFKF